MKMGGLCTLYPRIRSTRACKKYGNVICGGKNTLDSNANAHTTRNCKLVIRLPF